MKLAEPTFCANDSVDSNDTGSCVVKTTSLPEEQKLLLPHTAQ